MIHSGFAFRNFLPSSKVVSISGNCKNVLSCKTYVTKQIESLKYLKFKFIFPKVFRNVCFWDLVTLSIGTEWEMLSDTTALANLPHS